MFRQWTHPTMSVAWDLSPERLLVGVDGVLWGKGKW